MHGGSNNTQDIARYVELWLTLPDHIRVAVMALVDSGARWKAT